MTCLQKRQRATLNHERSVGTGRYQDQIDCRHPRVTLKIYATEFSATRTTTATATASDAAAERKIRPADSGIVRVVSERASQEHDQVEA